MIAFIEGNLIECQLNLAVIQTGGIGYEINVRLLLELYLLLVNQSGFIYKPPTEKIHRLYMDLLIVNPIFSAIVDKVSGIGPKIA